MSFWQKIIRSGKSLKPEFARKSAGSQESVATEETLDFAPEQNDECEAPPMPPARFELVEGSLFAGLNLHEVNLGNSIFSCWSYVSDGLGKYGQKEVSFLVKIGDGKRDDEYPLAPLGFLYTAKDYAAKGQLIDDWDITEFGESGFITPQFKAVAYLPPEPISVFESLGEIVTGIPITENELTVARTFGLTRLIGMLGQSFSHYPCPPWVDLDRPSVVTTESIEDMQQSIVAKLPHMRVPGVSVCLIENDVILKMKPIARTYIEEQLRQVPDSFPLVLRADLDRSANALLVWQPSTAQRGPSAITPPGSDGSRISGSFIVFLPEQDETEGQVLEDGFVMRMTNDVWAVLRKHLLHGTNIKIMADTQGMGLVLEWVQQDYENPVDGKTYHSTEGWQTVQPQRTTRQGGDVSVRQVVLLSTEEQLAGSISPQMLTNFAGLIETMVIQFFSRRPSPGMKELTVQCKILPQKKVEWMLLAMPETAVNKEKTVELIKQLDSLSVPTLSGEPISFQVIFSLQ